MHASFNRPSTIITKTILSIYLSSHFIYRDSFHKKFVVGKTKHMLSNDWEEQFYGNAWFEMEVNFEECVGHFTVFPQRSSCLDWYRRLPGSRAPTCQLWAFFFALNRICWLVNWRKLQCHLCCCFPAAVTCTGWTSTRSAGLDARWCICPGKVKDISIFWEVVWGYFCVNADKCNRYVFWREWFIVSYLGEVFCERVLKGKLLAAVWASISDSVLVMVMMWQWSLWGNGAKSNVSLDFEIIDDDNLWMTTLEGGRGRKEKGRHASQRPWCRSNL